MKKYALTSFSLLILLPSLAFASFDADLHYGSTGSAVTALQEFLIDQGVLKGQATGSFFSLTLKAVKAFQTRQGISPASGYFGPKTRVKANQILATERVSSVGVTNESGSTTPVATIPPKNITSPVTSSATTTKRFTTPNGTVIDEFGTVISLSPASTQNPPNLSVNNSPVALSSKQISVLVSPSVVFISTPSSSGSGFVIQEGKFILTNAHVVKSNSVVDVTLQDGRILKGTVLGRDEVIDLALLSTGNVRPPYAILGVSDNNSLMIGEDVYALGFPLGLSLTFTRGILSARQKIDGQVMLQTDASINPGNSGGPLVNSKGEVVGINTSRPVASLNAQGIGFAIPIDTAKQLIPGLISGLQNIIFETPSFGSMVVIPKSMVATIGINPNLSCENLGFTGNGLILCNLYKKSNQSYQWNISEN